MYLVNADYMFRSYFKIAWRNLLKNKIYCLVNIGGLTTGITCCILIGLYLSNETSYDRFHKNADRIVRATTEYTINGTVNQIGKTGSMPGPPQELAPFRSPHNLNT